ncbi:MAG: helix-turn-helix transcriptional regulator [Planctomycetota bacterium]
MKEQALDQLLAALSHTARRRILDLVMEAPGISVKALTTHFDVSRIQVLKHLDALETVDLILSKKEGRTRHLFFNPIPIQQLHDRWTTKYSAFWSERMVDIKSRVEGRIREQEEKKSG